MWHAWEGREKCTRLDSTGSGQGPVAGCCECGDEPSGSCATELVSSCRKVLKSNNVLKRHAEITNFI
jgi:hypothetical protein